MFRSSFCGGGEGNSPVTIVTYGVADSWTEVNPPLLNTPPVNLLIWGV